MLFKIAGRNVKRQLGNYLIYFITVALTVALMFSINNVIFSRQMMEKADTMENVATGLVIITVFVSLIVAFVLGYATSFMLKLRKREFGTYLIMGMTRRNILFIFTAETMLLCIAALAAGISVGMFIYQAMMAFMSKLMEVDITMADYSLRGLILTVTLVLGVFLLSSLASAFYLKRVKVYDLIYADKAVKKGAKHPVLWLTVSAVSFMAMAAAVVAFRQGAEALMKGESSGRMMILALCAAAVSIIVFHISIAKSIVGMLMKNKRLCFRGSNIFTLRQLSGKLNVNAVMVGIISFLITFAIVGANVSFSQKISDEMAVELNYPFDVLLIKDNFYGEEANSISIEDGEKIIEKYNDIEEKISYTIYDTGNNYLYGFTNWSSEQYDFLRDKVILESDFNRLQSAMGKETVDLEDEFIISSNYSYVDFSKARLSLNNKAYEYGGTYENVRLSDAPFFAVVPDEAADGLEAAGNGIAYDLKKDRYDAVSMQEELQYEIDVSENGASYRYLKSDYDVKEYQRIDRNNFSAIFVLGALYIAVVFVLLAMAVLALKLLSEISADRRRYRILFQLGAGVKEQSRTLFRQIFSFFFLPFALPVIASFPVSFLCGEIMKMAEIGESYKVVYLISAIIAVVTVILYILYFTATYLVAKRNVIFR